MKSYLSAVVATFGISALTLFSACQDEDFGYTTQDVRNSVYARNFEKHYGEIAPDQTWDFSSFNLNRLGLEGGPSKYNSTRAAAVYTGTLPTGTTSGTGISSITANWYTVDNNTINWLDTNLPEDTDNRSKGNPFSLVVPKDESGNNIDFVIIPIYQGHAGMEWELHLIAENNSKEMKDYTLWTKSQNIAYTVNFNNWGEYHYNSSNDYNVSDWADSGDGKKGRIKLASAFPGINSATVDGSNPIKLKFDLPEGGHIKGKFQINNTDINYGSLNGEKDITSDTEFDVTEYRDNLSNLSFYFTYANKLKNESGSWECIVSSYEKKRLRIFAQYNYIQEVTNVDKSYQTGHTIERTSVKSKGIYINAKEYIKEDFILALKVTKGESKFATNSAIQRSDEHMMLALTQCTEPKNLISDIETLTGKTPDSGEYMIIGCEDANLEGSDHDINDVCFLLVGLPKAPKIKEVIKKRYMIEDLGSTFDWDFNDIVVDVTQTRLRSVNGVIDNSQTHTNASLYRLCGTIPFKIKIGNTVLGEDYNGEGTRGAGVFPGNNADCEKGGTGYTPKSGDIYFQYGLNNVSVDGWNPEENNIIVTTWPNLAGWNPYTDQENGLQNTPMNDGESFCFPREGTKYPYIIACDQDIEPQKELINVPVGWFYTKPVIEEETPDSDTEERVVTPTHLTAGSVSVMNETKIINWSANSEGKKGVTLKKSALTSGDYYNYAFDLDTHVGEKLIVHVSNTGFVSGATAGIRNPNDWKQLKDAEDKDIEDISNITGDFEITITQSMVDNGLLITGKGYTIEKITCVCNGHTQKPTSGTYSFGSANMSFDLDKWSYHVDMANTNFNDNKIQNGDVIKVTFAKNGGTAALKDLNKWEELDGQQKDFNSNPATITLTVNDNNRQKLIDYGMAIQGEGVTFVKAELISAVQNNYSVIVNPGTFCGSVSISPEANAADGKYTEGTSITLTATPDDQWNYIFLGWFKDGSSTAVSTNEEYSFTLDSSNAGTYTAKYEKKIESYTLNNSELNFKLKDGNYAVKIEAPTIDSGKAYRLTLNFSGIDQSSASIKIFQINNSYEWVNVQTKSLVLNGSNGTYTIEFTSSSNVFGENGIAIQRTNDDNNSNIVFVNAKLEEITTSDGKDDIKPTELFNNPDNSETSNNSGFQGLAYGTNNSALNSALDSGKRTLKLYFKEQTGTYKLLYASSSWQNLISSDGTQFNNYTSTIVLTDQQASTLKSSNGLIVQATNNSSWTITKITIE